LTCVEPDSDWTWTHSCGWLGEGDGLGLVPDGDGLGEEPDGVGVGVLVGLGLDTGSLVFIVGGGAWLTVTVAVGESIGAAEGIVLSEMVGIGWELAVPDVEADGLTAAARTADCGRLPQADGLAGAAWELASAAEAARTLELRASSKKPATPPTAAGRTTDDAFTSTPSPSWLRRPQYWCSPCPSQLCPCKLKIPCHRRSTPPFAGAPGRGGGGSRSLGGVAPERLEGPRDAPF
jgi:hypothetical protein